MSELTEKDVDATEAWLKSQGVYGPNIRAVLSMAREALRLREYAEQSLAEAKENIATWMVDEKRYRQALEEIMDPSGPDHPCDDSDRLSHARSVARAALGKEERL